MEGNAHRHSKAYGGVGLEAGGARYRHVYFCTAPCVRHAHRRLAAVKACSWHSLHRLELRGAVPLSRAVAEAVARRCPQLADLRLVHRPPGRTADAALSGEAAAEYDYGRSQLLALCGPRLRELQLLSMETEQWWALSYMSLKWCTALTRLELEAPEWTSLQCGHGDGEC